MLRVVNLYSEAPYVLELQHAQHHTQLRNFQRGHSRHPALKSATGGDGSHMVIIIRWRPAMLGGKFICGKSSA